VPPVSHDPAILDAVASLTADIEAGAQDADVTRLRRLVATAATLRSRGGAADLETRLAWVRRLPLALDEPRREALRVELLRAGALAELEGQGGLDIQRHDEHEALLEGRLADRLAGLVPSERLGPFLTESGAAAWFDVFFGARRRMVLAAGSSRPLLVLTASRSPIAAFGTTHVVLDAGTVWIRGELLGASLPADAYVGVKITGGELQLGGGATVASDTIELHGPLQGTLRLSLAADASAPDPEGCTSAATTVTLPATLVLHLQAGGVRVEGDAAKASAWGQTFALPRPTGTWTFVAPLWTVVLGYEVEPTTLDTAPIPDALVRFEGTARITGAGLGLPVVQTSQPSVLGEVARAPEVWLALTELAARWYEPDPRMHPIAAAWLGIAPRGTSLFAEAIAPMSPPVEHRFSLWSTAEGGGRLPWLQAHAEPFLLLHRCDVVTGEQLAVSGRATVALDRPVLASGAPIPTPTALGILMRQRNGAQITTTLGATVTPSVKVQPLALRNALVWATDARVLLVRGEEGPAGAIDAGSAQLYLGVYAWAPTLPDPYVSSFHVRPLAVDAGGPVQAALVARISWLTPAAARLAFEGKLGPPQTTVRREPSRVEPRPAPFADEPVDLGPTQVALHRLSLDEKTSAAWEHARQLERVQRQERAISAQQANAVSLERLRRYTVELLGGEPQVLLVDVSTNQDLLGVGLGTRVDAGPAIFAGPPPAVATGSFVVEELAVASPVAELRIMALPQVQWEPVRTLDVDQDLITLGWFPTPLASATDGGPTQLGARSQRLVPVIPQDALAGTYEAFGEGIPVVFRTTLPFGLVTAVQLQPAPLGSRPADLYALAQPSFPEVKGGLQITAIAEGGRGSDGGVSPMFRGLMQQLRNGVDLASGAPLGLSVLGSTGDPTGSVEAVFNDDMAANPRVPVTRFDLSGYGGSSFSDWNDPFAAFAQAAKVQLRVLVGRTALEVIKVNSVLHPWGIRVTRSITVERRPGGGVIRRDSGWQAITPGMFDYRYLDPVTLAIVVPPYRFDAGIFGGLFDVRTIRPAPGSTVSMGGATFVPYYFDAQIALEGQPERSTAIGVLGYLQTQPSGDPASVAALWQLVEDHGPVGGPLDTWLDLGGSGLPFHARRIEVGLAVDAAGPIFVATVRGEPKLPQTGAWSVVRRAVVGVTPGGGEAVAVAESRGVPVIRRYPVLYPNDDTRLDAPPLQGPPSVIGPHRLADAADLLTPTAPAHEYALLQSTPTHAFLFPRPYVATPGEPRIRTDVKPALADVIARTTAKAAFPPPQNTIELPAAAVSLEVGPGGTLALSSAIEIVGHPVPLRIAGSDGHGSLLVYDDARLRLELQHQHWSAELEGLRIWTDIMGMRRITGSELYVLGSTTSQPRIETLATLVHEDVEKILQCIPLFGSRGVQGPIELGASNAKHEFKLDVQLAVTVPPTSVTLVAGADLKLKLYVKQSTGFDLATGGVKAAATFGASLEGRIPVLTIGVASVFIVVAVKLELGIASVSGVVKTETLSLLAFVGVGVEGRIGPFAAYAFLGIGFVLKYDAIADKAKYGGLVALEAGVDLTVVKVTLRAELQGLVYDDAGITKCDYSGSVKLQVDIFLIFSISATYQVTETASL
jgi:hypothetical protein